jgi:signal peptide peptidase SppA
MLATIAEVLARRAAGQQLSAEELQAALTKRDRLPQPTQGGVAVIPVHGVIVPRATMFSDVSGMTSVDSLRSALNEAMQTEGVETIVLDVDSPGGSVAGITEFARDVMRARTKKPIVAVAQYTMASAAYQIASAATEIVASPSSYVGSIGVYAIHDDLSKAMDEFGVKRTYIYAGKFKVDGNPSEALSETAREHMQASVNVAYERFVSDVSRGRGVSVDTVKKDFGQGRCLTSNDALAAGMVDKIATLDETIARIMSGQKPSRSAAALAADAADPDTSQELSGATDQDRKADRQFIIQSEREQLELAIPTL